MLDLLAWRWLALTATLSAPSFSDGAATGRFAGETGRCWATLGLLGAAGCISGSVCWGRIAHGGTGGAIASAIVGAIVTTIVLLLLLPYCSTT